MDVWTRPPGQGLEWLRTSDTTRETHRRNHDDDTEHGVRAREVCRVTPERDCAWRAWFLATSGWSQDEIMNGTYHDHGCDGDELARERMSNATVPERR